MVQVHSQWFMSENENENESKAEGSAIQQRVVIVHDEPTPLHDPGRHGDPHTHQRGIAGRSAALEAEGWITHFLGQSP